MNINVSTTYHLTNQDVFRIFQERLEQIRRDHFIRDGWVYHTIDMQGHGSDIDVEVAEVTSPDVELIVAAIRLQELTRDLCPNRLPVQPSYGAPPNHRMGPSIAPGKRCIDCGHFVQERS